MASQVDKVFCLDCIACGHYIYKTVWMPLLGETLTATPEPINSHDRHAWRTSVTTHCWVYRNSPLPCSRANSRALRRTALQVTCKFSALISSFLNGSSILPFLALQLATASHFFAGSFSKSVPCFYYSQILFSSISCIQADTLLQGIVNNLQLKCGVECSFLLYHDSGHSQSLTLCHHTCRCCHHVHDDYVCH